MRRPVVAALAALATLLTTASACQPEDPEPTGAEPTAKPTGSTGPTETEEPTTPEPLDPTTVDLGNRVWTYEDAWTAPFEVPLEDGVAEGEWDLAGEGPMVYDEAERVVVDMDGDDDLDVVAPLTYQEQLGGYPWTSWFVWLNDGTDLVQMPYAIAHQARCVATVEAVEPAGDGPGVRIDRLIMDLGAECAATPTVEADRTVVVEHDEHGDPWPVQIDPGRFWGGLCVGIGSESSEGEHEQDVQDNGPFPLDEAVVAPGLGPVEPPASEETIDLLSSDSDAWYGDLDGWRFAGITFLRDGALSTSAADEHCAWAPQG